MGYDYKDGELMRIAFAMYLDVLEYYYKFKSVQEKVIAREATHDNKGPSTANQDRSKSDSEAPVNEESMSTQYALFAGSDWLGMKKLHKRRRFDFKQAAKALEEANRSVLKKSSRPNLVYRSVLDC
ncbi:hypothetical protein Hanom_Chr15g01355531 [Helianthus anomalus]